MIAVMASLSLECTSICGREKVLYTIPPRRLFPPLTRLFLSGLEATGFAAQTLAHSGVLTSSKPFWGSFTQPVPPVEEMHGV